MESLDCISYKDYKIEVSADNDAGNPFTDWDAAPTLVLHNEAERHFGWTTDAVWQQKLTEALDVIAERGVTTHLYGPGGALEIVRRWMRIFHQIPVILPVSAIEHSGVAVYLDSGAHWADPGGWDSGWIGWLFATREQLQGWGHISRAGIEQSLRGSFGEFAAWVSGDVVGYQIVDPDGIEVTSCFGIYGSEALSEPDGWALQECRTIIDADIAGREHQLQLELVRS